MLQQTQVGTVTAYFKRFIKRFPRLRVLASATEQDVLRLWEGLGYYRRARDLHRSAQRLAAMGYAQIPNDPEIVGSLPGIGRYMLGAILSQAFDRRLPIIEANSERVLCRQLNERRNPRQSTVRKRLWDTAARLLPNRNVGDFNQALMELGALVCRPASPKCGECPIQCVCLAAKHGTAEQIPNLPKRRKPIAVQEIGVIVIRKGRVLIVQRPASGRWAGLWEFPHGAPSSPSRGTAAARRLLQELTSIRANNFTSLRIVNHAVNHHRITLHFFKARFRSGAFQSNVYTEGRWVRAAELSDYPFSAPQRQMAQQLL